MTGQVGRKTGRLALLVEEIPGKLCRKVFFRSDPVFSYIKTGPDPVVFEFNDRPMRFLVLDRNPVTKALESVIIHGQPLYDYLAREILEKNATVRR